MTEFEWHEGQVPAGLPVRQMHAWLADETGRFLLQDRVHEGKFLLPGGKCDSGDSGWAATLLRVRGRKPGAGRPGQPKPDHRYRAPMVITTIEIRRRIKTSGSRD